MVPHDSIQQVFQQVQTACQPFYAGNPAPFMALWSHADDVTIFGGWGAYEHGWVQVGPRLEWAAARFRGGHATFEPLAMAESGDLAYTIHLEKAEVRVEGNDAVHPMVLRVTHLYRREAGAWKIIHRHADPILEKTAATAVLQP